MTSPNALNAAVRKHKAALTRALKVSPAKVVEVCDAAFADFEVVGWPDNWSHWQRAKDDALLDSQRRASSWGSSW